MSILDLEDQQIELIVGDYFAAKRAAARESSDAEKKAAGRKWLTSPPEGLRKAICSASAVEFLLDQSEKDLIMIFAAVYAVVKGFAIFDLDSDGEKAAFAASAYWAHRGLHTLCGDESK
ncbi:hypothetical protein B7H23_03340 [Notoacmeibacter marinus]|uniref:Uncharacterized protein n=1 Tax=Notoacmeibacter marinus TaxID=1876515 RepID=A0A231V1J1_9HYPH|nr:hypothetical protein [Notoacmeibacter marinus]OXT01984.1 hypothetical protein B7H23_03340 [Notoacmeibacter marinus]